MTDQQQQPAPSTDEQLVAGQVANLTMTAVRLAKQIDGMAELLRKSDAIVKAKDGEIARLREQIAELKKDR